MIKNLISAAVVLLAINFLAIGGGVGWLFSSHHLDKDKVAAIKVILFPPPTTEPTTAPAVVASSSRDPTQRLEALLAKQSGHTPGEQMDFMRHTFDQQMAELDRREREITDLKRQTDLAQEKLTRDRVVLGEQQKTLTAGQEQATALAGDKGFQDSLQLYTSLQAKQVKNIFAGLDDATVTTYLHAMDADKAAKIIKEFKSPEETTRIERILERIRQAAPSSVTAPPAGSSLNIPAGSTASAAP